MSTFNDSTLDQDESNAYDHLEITSLLDALDLNGILSEEDYHELMQSDQPGVMEWKDYPCSNENIHHLDVRLTFDKATSDAWDSAKKETLAITSNVKRLLKLPESANPLDSEIYSIFFGPESRFINILMSKLCIDYATVKWLHDICIQAVYQISPKDLYEDEIIKNHLLLTEKENYNIWKHLSTVNQANNAIGHREDFIYEERKDEFNKISRAITIANRQGNIELVIDDDKVFCGINKCKVTYSLKYTTHVNDNRKGYVCHCCATTCTLFPISIKWEQQRESSHTCIESLLRGIFRNRSSGYPDL
jgi:hypothetical protein